MQRLKIATLLIIVLAFVAVEHVHAQTMTGTQRRVRVETLARDAIFNEDDVVSSERVVFRQFGSWNDEANARSATITGETTADATQLSILDVQSQSFQLSGQVNTWSIEDGTSRSTAESFVRINFTLPGPGGVEFDQLFLEGLRPQINTDPRDDEFERSDRVILFVRIFDQDSRVRVYNKTVRLNPSDTFKDFDDNVTVNLPAGRFRIDVKAIAFGTDQLDTVQGQPRAGQGFFFVEGYLFQN